MLEYRNNDPKIASPLAKLRGIIRRYVVIESLLAVGLFLAVWFWLAMLFDFGIFKLFTFDWATDAPKTLRTIMLVLACSMLLAVVVSKMLLRLTRDFSQSSLALILEKRFPAILGDRLITAVQLSDLEKAKSYGYSTQMIEKTINDVRDRMDQVPVGQAFNWKRLQLRGLLLSLATLGFFLVSGGAVCALARMSPGEFIPEFTEVSTILVERDVLLKNTPWPRRAYMELVDFPDEELRIVRGQDVSLRVVAYKWVIADSASPVGWRPLLWTDVPAVLPGENIIPLPGSVVETVRQKLPRGISDDPAKWTADYVEQVFVPNEEARDGLSAKFGIGSEVMAIQSTFDKLAERAADRSMSRTLKKHRIPAEVRIRGWGLATSVEKGLGAEPNNMFVVTLNSGPKDIKNPKDITESIRFYIEGENFATPSKQITLVPPPKLQELYRDEYQPAYLYHRAPFVEDQELDKEQKPYRSNPKLLKGMKQVVAGQPISLTGDKSRFDIPMGTDFVLRGKSDKPLVEVQLLPTGAGPGGGAATTATIEKPLLLPVIDGHGFEVAFKAENHTAITVQTDFDIFLRDTDNVTSIRHVQVVVKDDRPPEVNVEVAIIRKVDGVYMCTPQALIPFTPGSGATPGSTITDDNGLNRVDYVFSYYEIEPAAITGKRAEFAAWYWGNIPVFPNIGAALNRAVVHGMNYDKIKSDKAVVDTFTPLKAFVNDYTNRMETLDQIKANLSKPRPAAADQRVINRIDYRASESEPKYADEDKDEPKYSFDLRRTVPGLRRESENDVQRNYLLTLNVVAVDTNVDAAKPGTSQNKETLVFRLVSDAELLSRIAMDEAKLADELEDVIKKLTDMDNKFRSFTARVPSLQTPDHFVSEQTATNDMGEQLTAAKNKTSEVNAKYNSILLEYKTNRMEKNLITATKTKIVDKLGEVLDREFPEAEKSYGSIQGFVAQNRQPEAAEVFATQQKITVLLEKLRDIRGGIGQGLDFKKVITDAEALLKMLRLNKSYIENWLKNETVLIEAINLRVPSAPVSVAPGQKVVVRIPMSIGPAYSENYVVKFEPSPGSNLKVPEKITLKEGDRELTLEVTAGTNTGLFAVRIIPDAGPVKDLRVLVK